MKSIRLARGVLAASLGLVVAMGMLVVAGCESSNKQSGVAGKAVDGMMAVRAHMVDADKQVAEMLAATNDLSVNSDLSKSFARFTSELKKTEKMKAEADQRLADMRERRREYLSKWEDEVGQVTDPALRAGMAERQQKVRDGFNGLRESMRAAADAYKPFDKTLNDLQTALKLDLTPAGVKSAAPTIVRANTEGQTLRQKIAASIAELDKITSQMAPNQPAAK